MSRRCLLDVRRLGARLVGLARQHLLLGRLVLGAAQDVTVYATDSASTKSLDGAQEIGSATNANGTVVIKATGQLKPASKITVLVTKAAPAEAANHYRAQISEVTVR